MVNGEYYFGKWTTNKELRRSILWRSTQIPSLPDPLDLFKLNDIRSPTLDPFGAVRSPILSYGEFGDMYRRFSCRWSCKS